MALAPEVRPLVSHAVVRDIDAAFPPLPPSPLLRIVSGTPRNREAPFARR